MKEKFNKEDLPEVEHQEIPTRKIKRGYYVVLEDGRKMPMPEIDIKLY